MENDFEKRKDEFLQEYKVLIDKYEMDWMAYPMFTPNEGGTWDTRIQMDLIDKKGKPIKSPFVVQ